MTEEIVEHWCGRCGKSIEGNDWDGWDSWDCMVCGLKFHPQCLPPDFSGDNIICQKCRNNSYDDAA